MSSPRRAIAPAPLATTVAPRRALVPNRTSRLQRPGLAVAAVMTVAATAGGIILPTATPIGVAVAAPAGTEEIEFESGQALADLVPATTATPTPSALTVATARPDPAGTPTAPARAATSVSPTTTAAAVATQSSTVASRTPSASPTATRTPATPPSSTPTASATTRTPAPTPPAAPVGTVSAQVAAYARAHIGYPYRVGTRGPDYYDCAGLVTAAFASAGVTVRHSMTAQAALGRSVDRADLQPGDIVIWGDPVSAVSIYIGDDTIVIGDGPEYGVRTVSLSARMTYKQFIDGRRYSG